MTTRAAILSIGDEVMLGQSQNTNATWLARELAARSLMAVEHRTVEDDQAEIARAIGQLADRADLLVITGGLGPTDDDLTREALAEVMTPGEALVQDERAVKWLEDRFAGRFGGMPESNLRQTFRPANMQLLPNPHGTAPGLSGTLGSTRVFALPGPPREMHPMFHEHVSPEFEPDAGAPVLLSDSVRAFGLGESDAAQRLGDLTDRRRNPLVGTTVSESILAARIRARGKVAQARAMVLEDMQRIEEAWWPYAFGRGDETLAAVVGRMLLEQSRSLVTAESCTGGLLGKMLVDVPGSSSYYHGGWITYSNDMKTLSLAVSHELLQAHGAVSRQTAEAMASGALANVESADYALAITGIAGPDGGSVLKPVGTVFIALARLDDQLVTSSTRQFRFPGDRTTVRDRAAKSALQMLRFALLGEPEQTPLLWEVRRESPAPAGAP